MSGNSPLWRGYDTGYDSWRTVLLRRWTTTGCPPSFVDAADYDRRLERLLGIGGTADLALIAWDVRLSEHLPTIEFRMGDAQLDAESIVLITALCRALVDACARRRPEATDAAASASARRAARAAQSAALLHSAHFGHARARCFDPSRASSRPRPRRWNGFIRLLEPR